MEPPFGRRRDSHHRGAAAARRLARLRAARTRRPLAGGDDREADASPGGGERERDQGEAEGGGHCGARSRREGEGGVRPDREEAPRRTAGGRGPSLAAREHARPPCRAAGREGGRPGEEAGRRGRRRAEGGHGCRRCRQTPEGTREDDPRGGAARDPHACERGAPRRRGHPLPPHPGGRARAGGDDCPAPHRGRHPAVRGRAPERARDHGGPASESRAEGAHRWPRRPQRARVRGGDGRDAAPGRLAGHGRALRVRPPCAAKSPAAR